MAKKSFPIAFVLTAISFAIFSGSEPALAHHVMGGRQAATFGEGLLSGLAHPIIGLDHLAAVIAIGCLAAAHRAARWLVIGYVIAMMLGVAAHLFGTSVPAAEVLVALTVLGLGGVLLLARDMSAAAALTLFALVGLIHGYALGESIYGAERTPVVAYLIGLAVIQSVVALGAMTVAQAVIRRADVVTLRLVGAGIAGIGIAILVQQAVPGA